MPIYFKDVHLEQRIRNEQIRRGDATPTKTARSILIDALSLIEEQRRTEVLLRQDQGSRPVNDVAG